MLLCYLFIAHGDIYSLYITTSTHKLDYSCDLKTGVLGLDNLGGADK